MHKRNIIIAILLLVCVILGWLAVAPVDFLGTRRGAAESAEVPGRVPGAGKPSGGHGQPPVARHGAGDGDATGQFTASAGIGPAGAFTVLESTPERVRILFQLPEYEITEVTRNGTVFSMVKVPDALYSFGEDEPVLPFYQINLGLAPAARYNLSLATSGVEAVSAAPPPAGIPPLTANQLFTQGFPELTSSDAKLSGCLPRENVQLTKPFLMRQLNGIGVVINPFQYDYSEKKLLACRSLEFTVTAEALSEDDDVTTVPQLDANGSLAALQRSLFLNSASFARGEDVSTVGQLLLLVPDEWRECAEEFARWKRQIGYTVTLCGYPSETGETAEDIQAYLKHQYEENHITHVILLGDANRPQNTPQLPPYQLAANPDGPPSTASGVTSDIPYSLITDDMMPDFCLSRIPADSASELAATLARLQDHEAGLTAASAETGAAQRALYLASDERDTSRAVPDYVKEVLGFTKAPYDYEVMEKLDMKMKANGTVTESALLSEEEEGYVAPLDIVSELNTPPAMFFYLGHGSNYRLSVGNFSTKYAQDICNGDGGHLPFFFNYVCDINNFVASAPCYGETMLNATSGATCGVIGGSSEVFWYQPIVAYFTMADELEKFDQAEHLSDLGTIFIKLIQTANVVCTQDDNPDTKVDSAQYNVYATHFLGDCSQVPRMGIYRELAADWSISWENNQAIISLTASHKIPGQEENRAVSQAQVCLQYGDDCFISGRLADDGTMQIIVPEDAKYQKCTLRILDVQSPLTEISFIYLGEGKYIKELDDNTALAWLTQWRVDYAAGLSTCAERDNFLKCWSLQGTLDAESSEPPLSRRASRSSLSQGGNSLDSDASTGQSQLLQGHATPRGWFDSQDENNRRALLLSGAAVLSWQEDGTALLGASDAQWQAFTELGGSCFSQTTGQTRGDTADYSSRKIAATFAEEYPTLAEITEKILEYSANYYPVCQVAYLGQSCQQRDLLAVRVSRLPLGTPAPELLVAAGIHGNEKPGTDISMRFLGELLENQEKYADLLDNAVVWFLPICNPDGYVLDTRENAEGFDLNRNFPDGFELPDLTLSEKGQSMYFSQTGLQPEQSAIMAWALQHKFVLALHLHTGSLLVCYPYGRQEDISQKGTSPTPDDSLLQYLGNAYVDNSANIETLINACSMYPIVGELADWQYRTSSTLPLTVELSLDKEPAYASTQQIWEDNKPALLACLRAALNGISGVATVNGQPLPGLQLNCSTGQEIFTDSQGFFHRPLEPGNNYQLTAHYPGLEDQSFDTGEIIEEQPVTWNPELTCEHFLPLPTGAQRWLPYAENQLQWKNLTAEQAGRPNDLIVRLTVPPEMVFTVAFDSTYPDAAMATRLEADNTLAWLLCLPEEQPDYLPIFSASSTNDTNPDEALNWTFSLGDSLRTSGSRRWLPLAQYYGGTYSFAKGLQQALAPAFCLNPGCGWYQWDGSNFALAERWQPGYGYLRWSDTATTLELQGWRPEFDDIPLQHGWFFGGYNYPRPEIPGFSLEDKAWTWQNGTPQWFWHAK